MIRRTLLVALCGVCGGPASALAFAEGSFGPVEAELRGNLRWLSFISASTDEDLPGGAENHAVFLRAIGDLTASDGLSSEFHLLQFLSGSTASASALPALNLAFRGGERNRTHALHWTQSTSLFSAAFMEVDRLSVRLSLRPFDITVGRQPISLATSYLFTPNDFFAPFFAQSFYRLYKPGVDAARVDMELGEFTGLSLYGVLGYAHGAESRASDPVSLKDSSLLARAFTNLFDVVDVSILGGYIADFWLVGGGFQGELFGWLGVRGEGHVTFGNEPMVEFSLGIEHRFESSLHLRAEYFHHGAGASDPTRYLQAAVVATPSELPYFGRHYAAVGASYELSPLLVADVLILANMQDPSAFATIYFAYSLLDEVELAVSAAAPLGRGPSGSIDPSVGPLGELILPDTIESEFGLYPFTLNAELRAYF